MARSRPRDDDDDDEDDRPRKKRRRDDDDDDDRGSAGNKGTIIAVSVVGGVLLLVGLVVLVIFATRSKKKDDEPDVAANANPNPAGPNVPGNPFAPKPKGDEQPKLGAGVVQLPVAASNVQQVVFGPRAGPAAIVSFDHMGRGNVVDVVQPSTGKPLGRVKTDSPFVDCISVGMDGKWVAIMDSAPSEGNTIALHSVADDKLEKKFRPYPKKDNPSAPNLVWMEFVGTDRIMTFAEDGGFDLWTVPAFQHVARVDQKLEAGLRLTVDGFSKMPVNFAFSPKREELAVFNGTGFTFYAASTGALQGRTPPFAAARSFPQFNGLAFTPDGKRLAAFYQTFGAGGGTHLQIWDAAKGTSQSDADLGNTVQAPAGMAFWGQKHLVFHEGGVSRVRVFDIAAKQEVGRVSAGGSGKFAVLPSDGDLWAVVCLDARGTQPNSAHFSKGSPPAAGLTPGSEWELNLNGLQSKIATPPR